MSGERRGRDLRLDPQFVQRTLRQAGLRARHNLSQNFLADVDVLEGILREADPASRARRAGDRARASGSSPAGSWRPGRT